MKKIPDAVFVIDGIFEEQAISEANSLKILAYAVLNTNGDDSVLKNCIPANTNSVKSIDYIAAALRDALSGKVRDASTSATSTISQAKVKKIDDTKVSGEKKVPAKKAPAKKVEEVKAEVETTEQK